MIEGTWKRIAGMTAQDDGDIAVVWLAHDKDTDMIHVYDACMFKSEVFAVIAEGINARGRWIPIAYEQSDKDTAKRLEDRGCTLVYEPYKETPTIMEVVSREIWERLRTGRLKVDKRLKNWQDEYKTYYRDDSKIPCGHPLMTATRVALANIENAKSNMKMRRKQTNYPRMAIV